MTSDSEKVEEIIDEHKSHLKSINDGITGSEVELLTDAVNSVPESDEKNNYAVHKY